MVRIDATTGDTSSGESRKHTSTGLQGVGTEGEDIGGEAGFGFVRRYGGGGRLGGIGHRSNCAVENLEL